MKLDKEYLGDAVYINFDGLRLVLTTEEGIRVTNTIYLNPKVYEALVYYVKRLRNTVGEKQ